MGNELPTCVFWRTRFKEPHPVEELVWYLRQVADELEEREDGNEVVWTHLHQVRDVEEGDPERDREGIQWATWSHTGAGELHVRWDVRTAKGEEALGVVGSVAFDERKEGL